MEVLRYDAEVSRASPYRAALTAAIALAGTACFERTPIGPPTYAPAAATAQATSTSLAGAGDPAAGTGDAPEPTPSDAPEGFPAQLPTADWLKTRRLRPHLRCTPQCGPLPVDRRWPAPAALFTTDLESAPQRFERDGRIDVYGVVLYGHAVLVDHGYGTDYDLEPWQAFHAPGAGISLTGGHPAPRLALAVVSDGAPVGKVLDESAQAWALRPGELEVVDLALTDGLAWAGGRAQARVAFERGRASFGLLSATAAAPVPEQEHPRSWELVGLLAGEGELRLERPEGAASTDEAAATVGQHLRAADVAAVPPDRRHRFIAAPGRVIFAVQLYTPPGPEQRFRQLAGLP